MTLLSVIVYTLTHYFRNEREKQLIEAHHQNQLRNYKNNLLKVTQAEKWPGIAKPGRIEYLKAEAYAGLGDYNKAESYYLRSYKSDPEYFWCVADMAIFYASSDKSVFERRHLALPYLSRLKNKFTNHQDRQSYIDKLEQKLKLE